MVSQRLIMVGRKSFASCQRASDLIGCCAMYRLTSLRAFDESDAPRQCVEERGFAGACVCVLVNGG